MRITGGTLRSRQLQAPRGQSTRPTSDRVREALFGILGSAGAVVGARVLDLYAGTGALALEALSRGAAQATLVESSREALTVLRTNVSSLGQQGRAQIVSSDVRAYVARGARLRKETEKAERFDLVLADPPWALVDEGGAGGPGGVIASLAQSGALADHALVVLEHAARSVPPEIEGLTRTETRRYGDTALTFYKTGILAAPLEDPRPTSE
jgi:16S rRNA (guanine(966)-N(2))-methyltransferase RsmD